MRISRYLGLLLRSVLSTEMRRAKQQGSDIAGDWSVTGTFLRKPSGGWLHEDRELQNGLSINYNVQVCLSYTVFECEHLVNTVVINSALIIDHNNSLSEKNCSAGVKFLCDQNFHSGGMKQGMSCVYLGI